MSKRIVSIGHLGNYYVAVKPILMLFADEIIIPPRISRYTLEIGNKYSPESACIPFKYTLGNFIEALDKGANLLIQLGGVVAWAIMAKSKCTSSKISATNSSS